jgi:hypothetical protein
VERFEEILADDEAVEEEEDDEARLAVIYKVCPKPLKAPKRLTPTL